MGLFDVLLSVWGKRRKGCCDGVIYELKHFEMMNLEMDWSIHEYMKLMTLNDSDIEFLHNNHLYADMSNYHHQNIDF